MYKEVEMKQLTEQELELLKETYIGLLSKVEREGIDKLINFLENESRVGGCIEFFKAPASTQHHGAFEGALVLHMLLAFWNLRQQLQLFGLQVSLETCILVALLHDLCKIGFYKVEIKPIKKKDLNNVSKWHEVEMYVIDEQIPFGHAEKSILLLNKYIRLTMTEYMAIRWHMGKYTCGASEYVMDKQLSQAFNEYPLAKIFHLADDSSANIWENDDIHSLDERLEIVYKIRREYLGLDLGLELPRSNDESKPDLKIVALGAVEAVNQEEQEIIEQPLVA